ncbi:MAG TPA: NUDIX domain-containing protein [Paracoccaceae bacterium]
MADFFFYGTLCHAPLLRVVLGREVVAEPASLPGHAVFWAEGQTFPVIVEEPGRVARGILLRDLSAADVARLDFYEGGFDYQTRDLTVDTGAGQAVARVYFAVTQRWRPGAVWSLDDWAARWGATVVATAGDFMALYGQRSAAEVRARYHPMLVRGASRVRAGGAAPAQLRRAAGPGDVVVAERSLGYANFFAVEDYALSYRRFDGGLSPRVARAVFVSGDAVTVLPYDPVRDRVLLVEQFRLGPMARGDAQPWQLEAIAGRIDPGETPEETARREAVEEAGLELGALLPVANYYPSPGAKTEFLYSYVALTDLPDGVAGVFGMADEAEDIRGHLVPFDTLMALVESGEVANAPLVLTALWLARERARLRAGVV